MSSFTPPSSRWSAPGIAAMRGSVAFMDVAFQRIRIGKGYRSGAFPSERRPVFDFLNSQTSTLEAILRGTCYTWGNRLASPGKDVDRLLRERAAIDEQLRQQEGSGESVTKSIGQGDVLPAPAQDSPSRPAIAIPSMAIGGRFEVIGELGSGGMG